MPARNNEPTVSVIIPTRDRPDFLNEAVESVRAQSMENWEAIVVDDGSTNPPPLPDDPRIKYVRHKIARGPAGARNTGLSMAGGEFVVFLDDDDKLAPAALELLLERAAPSTIVFGLAGELQSGLAMQRETRWNGYLGGEIVSNSPGHWQGIYPRSTCERYDEDFRTGEDFDWLLRMGAAHELVTIEHVTYLKRVHDSPRAGIGTDTHLSGRLRLLEKHTAWFRNHPFAHSIQLTRAASAALSAREYRLATSLALASLRRRASIVALKVLIRGVWAGLKDRHDDRR